MADSGLSIEMKIPSIKSSGSDNRPFVIRVDCMVRCASAVLLWQLRVNDGSSLLPMAKLELWKVMSHKRGIYCEEKS